MSDHPMVQFCPCCFADEKTGSWNHVVVSGHCANCGNGTTIVVPVWAVREIRRNASWVGKRYYPAEEDHERRDERDALLSLVTEFPGRTAEPFEDHWRVMQILPHGKTVSTLVKAENADAAIRACGLTFVPAEKLR